MENREARKVYEQCLAHISEAYQRLLRLEVTKEDARFVSAQHCENQHHGNHEGKLKPKTCNIEEIKEKSGNFNLHR